MSYKANMHALDLIMNPILHNVNEGVLITDTFQNVIFMNESAEKIFNIDSSSILGKHVDLLKPSLNFYEMISKRELYLQEKEFIKGNEVIIRKGLLEVNPNSFVCYAIFRVIDSFEDDQLNSLLQSPYEGIAVFDDHARFLWANEVCYKYFKCKSKEDLKDNLNSLIPHSTLRSSINEARPLFGRTISNSGRALDLVYLPIIRSNRTIGVIVKSTFSAFNPPYDSPREPNNGSARYSLEDIAGSNKDIIKQKKLAIKAARTTSTVLITGESGTGKEVFAHSIHNLSSRRKGPFIKVNCAAVPETLLESELFGYAEGAFTGARKEGKPGRFEQADNGTIFLDEIADMSMAMQGKLLRVLQERELERVGGVHSTRINVRVIAATNKNLNRLVKEQKFREDLYYRLNVVLLNLPPLRERKEDITVLSRVLLLRLNEQLGTNIKTINQDVLSCFQTHEWPGNIRELENVLERAVNFCEHDTITMEHLPEAMQASASKPAVPSAPTSLERHLQEREREAILQALENSAGNKSQAAKYLKIHRSALYRKMHKYNINY
ncbi:two component, sigma54 specific, transcriptional regulator, fis family [hydrocarbon metagenome]|uniref:Two component, sigma54 specific, transcriptional regulator, fis family n=1 Tax=hydrocarbon metagenome TaxID=938273 RepID=A0A0W8E5D9_9ZZZZ